MDENQNKLINQVKEEMQYVDAYQKAVKQRRKLSKENAMLERQADQLSLDKEILKGQINDVVAKIDSGQFGNISKKQIALDTTGYTATVDESESKKVGRRLLLWMILLEVVLLVISSVSGITSGNFVTNTTAEGLKNTSMMPQLLTILPVYIALFDVWYLKKHHKLFDNVNKYLTIKPVVNYTRVALLIYSFIFVSMLMSTVSSGSHLTMLQVAFSWGAFFAHFTLGVFLIKKANNQLANRFKREAAAVEEANRQKYELQVQQADADYNDKVQQAKAVLTGLKNNLLSNSNDVDNSILDVTGQIDQIESQNLPAVDRRIAEIKQNLPRVIPMADQYRFELPYYQLMLEALQSMQATEWGHANELATDRFQNAKNHDELMNQLKDNQQKTLDAMNDLARQNAEQNNNIAKLLFQLDTSVQSGFANVQGTIQKSSEAITASNKKMADIQERTNQSIQDANNRLQNIDRNMTMVGNHFERVDRNKGYYR
ncbi:ABC transporter permease [Fructobacillus fructosus]|uniref:ABC transporter permease n=1 Tax=Fructobacillus fructosus TaxID=1631 RepID=UPI0002195A77|nr:ABC transporter permease [Fructobacillus fructosus]MBD9366535.1 ABC transporter permease [Leuconostoc mesenteroides]KRN52944.1 hypothetical protein IV71_GL000839 [Fructobacillus fructosus KCTC 3544]MBC9119231.1 ABC transporter permease [Fructobacillus fructosus]CAK1249370.1 unnamed protein product [Fructobacillus fructosus]GAP01011.1 hypothetical protein FFRU_030550 [Fructobacillus fructosus]